MTIFLDSVDINGFRSFGENQTVTFDRDTLYSLIGINEDDGGSNGSAKSSLVMAIAVGTYGSDAASAPLSELKNFYLDTPTRITVNYTVNGESFTIDRTLGGKVRIKSGDGPWEEGKASDIQDKINEKMQLTSSQFMAMCYKEQGDFSGFLLKKSSDKVDFLNSFISELGLLEKALDSVKLNKQSLESRIRSLMASLDTRRAVAIEREQALTNLLLKEPEISLKRSELDILLMERDRLLALASNIQEKISEFTPTQSEEIKDLVLKKDILLCEINSLLPLIESGNEEMNRLSRERDAAISTLDSQKKAIEADKMSLFKRCYELKSFISSAKNSASLLEIKKQSYHELIRQKSALNEASCSHCGQGLPESKKESMSKDLDSKMSLIEREVATLLEKGKTASLEAELGELEGKISSLDAQIADISTNILNLPRPDLTDIKNQINLCSDTIFNNKKRMVEIDGEIKVLQNQELSSLRQELAAIQGSVNLNKISIDTNSIKISEYDRNLALAKAKVEEIKGSTDAIESQLNESNQELNILIDMESILGRNGFTSYLFDGILDDLNIEANNNLQTIPNAQKFSIEFLPEKTAKTTGNLTKTLDYKIRSDNSERSIKTLSGGEQLSVILAVDEALDTILSRRLGVHLGFKVLDEQFSFIDGHSKEAILDFYRSKSVGKTYIIVDHASEFNAAIENQIIIRKKNKISTVEQSGYG